MATTKTGKDKLNVKKDKVMHKKSKLSATSISILVIIGAMAVGGFFLIRGGGSDVPQTGPSKQGSRVAVSGPVDYTQGRVDMTNVGYKTEGGNVVLSLADVIKNKFVRFEFSSPKINVQQRNFSGKSSLPVMAMVAPSGKLMVAVSYCEPCRATTFHTESDVSLTCNICGTKWDLESLQAWSGACTAYPPDELKVAVKGDKVLIPKSALESWQPRQNL